MRMKLAIVLIIAVSPFLSACQIGYLAKSAMNQVQILSSRESIEDVLKDPKTSTQTKEKLLLAKEVMGFAHEQLGLVANKNYQSFVDLKRPYVSWVVSAAPKWKLEHHQFHYPFLGDMPYKGFFSEQEAKDFAKELQAQDLDTYVRGVRAYSTLGWFRDPILSSMLDYSEYDYVNTLIHETVHATLYIKNNADFNERLAVFIGNKGAELFYRKKEGQGSATLARVQVESEDEIAFSGFISAEISSLKRWYEDLASAGRDESEKRKRISEIQTRFKEKLRGQLKSRIYDRFPEIELNNARLMLYRTYMQDLSDFQKVFEKRCDSQIPKFIELMKTLEKEKNPEEKLKELG